LQKVVPQVRAVKQVCSRQNQAMVALPNLQSYGIAEDDTLNLNSFFERNMMNNKIFSRGLGEVLRNKADGISRTGQLKNVKEQTPSS
jgi:hypothetical protein